jgi:arylsulfatase A-like enzyme
MVVCRLRVLPLNRVRALAVYPILVALVVAAPAAADSARQIRPAPRPNILILLTDDQRADTIAALGNPHIRTPNLDRLVRRGTAFTRAYCMGSLQGAVCVPSRAMLLSGRTLFHAKTDLAGQSTWPESFRNAGYATFLTGKWHNEADSALRLFDQGKAIFLGGMGDPYTLPLQDISPQHAFVKREQNAAHSVKLFADATIEFLRGRTDEAPFMCYVAFNAPHDPRTALPSFHEWYNKHQPPLPPNFLPQHPFDNGEMVIRDERLAPWPRTPEVVRRHLSDYYASIEFLDEQVGHLVYGSTFTAYTDVQRAVRDERWKLIVYPKINVSQLFDLENDPAELHDLADDPQHANERKRLSTLLRDWQKQLGDSQPLTSESPRPKEFVFSTFER